MVYPYREITTGVPEKTGETETPESRERDSLYLQGFLSLAPNPSLKSLSVKTPGFTKFKARQFTLAGHLFNRLCGRAQKVRDFRERH
jgi:hypothetical protein